jgi:hypothetical protein
VEADERRLSVGGAKLMVRAAHQSCNWGWHQINKTRAIEVVSRMALDRLVHVTGNDDDRFVLRSSFGTETIRRRAHWQQVVLEYVDKNGGVPKLELPRRLAMLMAFLAADQGISMFAMEANPADFRRRGYVFGDGLEPVTFDQIMATSRLTTPRHFGAWAASDDHIPTAADAVRLADQLAEISAYDS